MIKIVAAEKLHGNINGLQFGFCTPETEKDLFFAGEIKVDVLLSLRKNNSGYLFYSDGSIIVPVKYNNLEQLSILLPKPYLINNIQALKDKEYINYSEHQFFIDYNLEQFFPILSEKKLREFERKMASIVKHKMPFTFWIPIRNYLNKKSSLENT